jgi:hypothetical protein
MKGKKPRSQRSDNNSRKENINKHKEMISENIDVILTPFSVRKNFRRTLL